MSTLKVNNIEASTGSEIDINSTLGTIPSIVVTGVTTVAAGTTAAPSISPTGDSNTGIFFPSADTVAIAEGGVEVFRIDSTGSTLINTTTQSTSNGGLNIATNSSGTTTTALGLQNRSTGNNSGVYIAHRGLTNVGAESDYNYIEMVSDNTTSKTGSIRFHTVNGSGPAERARITSTGNVQIANGNLVFSTAGTGIDFSATANSSGTMTSELLSDYEEGTFTPSLTFGSGSTGITYAHRNGSYIKIGRVVIVRVGMLLSNKGSSTGTAVVSGLPFTVESISYADATGCLGFTNMSGLGGGPLVAVCQNTGTGFTIWSGNSTSRIILADTNFGNSTEFYGTITYTVA